MKACLTILAILSGPLACATEEPKPRIVIEEQFFGSNASSYALLRTQSEPLKEGKGTRKQIWLDHYSKEAVSLYDKARNEESRIRHAFYDTPLKDSVKLLEVISTQADTEPEEEIVMQDEIPMSKLLLLYPNRSLQVWPAEKMAQLRMSDSSFFIYYKLQCLVNGKSIRARMGGDRMGDAQARTLIGPRVVDSIGEDGNCVYVTLTATSTERKQTRVICLVPAVTRNIHALDSKPDLLLTTGQLKVKGDALHTARAVRKTLDDSSFAHLDLEVWSYFDANYNRDFYFVAFSNSMDLIKTRKVEALQELTGKDLMAVKSEMFQVRIETLAGKPD